MTDFPSAENARAARSGHSDFLTDGSSFAAKKVACQGEIER
jgi:hypothetical protein